ncbi:alpha/beta fold hydrolase [Plastorhodobacter daqingensis]|uniref:Alpha/beta fold hydrolase n=1 Tax=Plastorhodobacter daqingensis TaxID=1387281 RepID=A0ABW2UJC6_9RHOB
MNCGPIDVPGGRLWCDARGTGAPVVLVHGFSFDLRSWAPQAEALSGRYRVIRHDLRGFGRSDVPTGPYSHAEDLAEVIGHLGLHRPLVVGLSLGANVAMAYALQYPHGLSGLVLASPGLPGHRWTRERPPDAAMAFARDHDLGATRRFWLDHPMFASLQDHPDARARVAEMVADYGGWHWRNEDMQHPAAALSDRIAAIKVPTLVISGGRDDPGYREIAEVIAATIPQAELLRFDRAGHMVNLEEPDAFNRAVADFAARCHFPVPSPEAQ